MKKKAFGYARKSIKLRGLVDERENVLYQLNQIDRFAMENEVELIETYSDIGYSGVLKNRPELNRMLEDLKQRETKVNYLILYNQDRLARDLSTSIELVLEITEYVDEVVFVADDMSSSVKNFREIFLMNAARIAEERRRLKQRLRYGRQAKVTYGHFYRATNKPLGYIQIKKRNLVLATIEHTRDMDLTNDLIIVQCIFLAYLSKMSFRQIAKWLNENFGLTKKNKEWDYNSVKYILQNPVYAGMLTGVFITKENVTPVETIQPLISVSLFQYIQQKMESETSGNKPKRMRSLPDLSMCLECFKPLSLSKEMYYCPLCKGEIKIETYFAAVREKIISLLRGEKQEDKSSTLWMEKKQHLIIHQISLKKIIAELLEREKELKVHYAHQQQKLEKLLDVNRKEQIKMQKRLVLEQEFFRYLFGTEDKREVPVVDLQLDYLIGLPYLIFVDFKHKKIQFKFHSSIFSEDKQNESGILQMVDESVCLLEDFG